MEQPAAAVNVQLLQTVGRKEGLEEEHKRVALPETQEAGESKGTIRCCSQPRGGNGWSSEVPPGADPKTQLPDPLLMAPLRWAAWPLLVA